MSVIVAIKKDGVVYFGADSQATRGSSRTSLSNPNNYKIWKVFGANNCLMGCVGEVRDACAIRVVKNLTSRINTTLDTIDYEYVVDYVEPSIKECLKDHEFIDHENPYGTMNSRFIFAHKDKLFTITCGCVLEHDDFVAIGSGECEAIGSLLSTTECQDVKTRIIKAIKASAANDIYVDYPIVLCDTASEQFEIITDRNERIDYEQEKKK